MGKFSIILPVRNGGNYVKECVNSILAQSYGDFNLIVLDNASTDGTYEWINSLKDPRIVIHRSEQSLTIEQNWARILRVEKNEYITLIGHDDLLDSNYLKVMDDLISKHSQASLYQTHFRYIDSDGALIRKSQPMDAVQKAPEFTAAILSNSIDSMGTGFMLRAADYDRLGGIPDYPNLLFADFELWINSTKISYKATSPEECFAFRLHQGTTRTSPDIKFQSAFDRFMLFLAVLKKESREFDLAINHNALNFIKTYCRSLSHRLLRTPYNMRNGYTVDAFVSRCKQYADQLVPGNQFHPKKEFSIKLAAILDSTDLGRSIFRAFKKIYPKPFFK